MAENRIVNVSDQLFFNGIGPLDAKLKPVASFKKLPTLSAYEGMVLMVLDEGIEYKYVKVNGKLTWVKNCEAVDVSELSASTVAIGEEVKNLEAKTDELNKKFDNYATSADTVAAIDDAIITVTDIIYDIAGKTEERFKKDEKELKDLADTTKSEFEKVDDAINALSANTFDEVERLDERIDTLSAETEAEVARLDERVDNLSADTAAEIAKFSESVEKAFEIVDETIDELSANTEAEIVRLDEKIDAIIKGHNTINFDYIASECPEPQQYDIEGRVISMYEVAGKENLAKIFNVSESTISEKFVASLIDSAAINVIGEDMNLSISIANTLENGSETDKTTTACFAGDYDVVLPAVFSEYGAKSYQYHVEVYVSVNDDEELYNLAFIISDAESTFVRLQRLEAASEDAKNEITELSASTIEINDNLSADIEDLSANTEAEVIRLDEKIDAVIKGHNTIDFDYVLSVCPEPEQHEIEGRDINLYEVSGKENMAKIFNVSESTISEKFLLSLIESAAINVIGDGTNLSISIANTIEDGSESDKATTACFAGDYDIVFPAAFIVPKGKSLQYHVEALISVNEDEDLYNFAFIISEAESTFVRLQRLEAASEDAKNEIAELSASTIDINDNLSELSASTVNIENNVNDLSASTIELTDNLAAEVDALSAATESEVARLDEKIDDFKSETEKNFETVNDAIDNLSANTEAEIVRLDGKVDNLADSTKKAFEVVDEAIEDLSANTESEVARLDEKINTFADEVDNEFKNVNDTIEALSAGTEAEVAKLNEKVNNLADDVDKKYDEVNDAIEELSAGTENEVSRLDSKVDNLAESTKKAFEVVDETIEDLSASTESEVARLDEKIDSANYKHINAYIEAFDEADVKEAYIYNRQGTVSVLTGAEAFEKVFKIKADEIEELEDRLLNASSVNLIGEGFNGSLPNIIQMDESVACVGDCDFVLVPAMLGQTMQVHIELYVNTNDLKIRLFQSGMDAYFPAESTFARLQKLEGITINLGLFENIEAHHHDTYDEYTASVNTEEIFKELLDLNIIKLEDGSNIDEYDNIFKALTNRTVHVTFDGENKSICNVFKPSNGNDAEVSFEYEESVTGKTDTSTTARFLIKGAVYFNHKDDNTWEAKLRYRYFTGKLIEDTVESLANAKITTSTDNYLKVNTDDAKNVVINAVTKSIADAKKSVTEMKLKDEIGVNHIYVRDVDGDASGYLAWKDENDVRCYTKSEPTAIGEIVTILPSGFNPDLGTPMTVDSLSYKIDTGLADAYDVQSYINGLEDRIVRLEEMIKRIDGGLFTQI